MRLFILLFLTFLSISASEKPDFKFSVVADCQYCNKPDKGVRKYKNALKRFEEFVELSNKVDLKFGVHLGDFIDEKYESFEPLLKLSKGLKYPFYHVLGNHDFSVKDERKSEVPKLLGMPARYYSFEVENWVFVALDGNDLSFHGHPKESAEYKESEKYYIEKKIKSPKWNGGMSAKQINWLKGVLQKASDEQKKVVLFSHFPVYPENNHNLWNDKEIMELISSYKCVKAYINGHNHKGNYGDKNGIHYYTQKGMVEQDECSFSIISVYKEKLVLKGYGVIKDKVFTLR